MNTIKPSPMLNHLQGIALAIASATFCVACDSATVFNANRASSDSAISSGGGSGSPGTNSQPADNLALKVMPLGDSITAGYNSCSYRSPLIQLLQSNQVEFVGSLAHRDTQIGDCAQTNMAHEGRSGFRTIDWLNNVDNGNSRATVEVTNEKPDIVLLHLGSNDMNRGELPGEFNKSSGTGTETIGRINQIIDQIFTASPGVTIFLADLLPWLADPTIDTNLTQLRNEIHRMAEYRELSGDRLRLVRVFENFERSYMQPDLIHPNATGDSYLAQQWLQAMQNEGYFLTPGTISNIRVEAETGELAGKMEIGVDSATFVKATAEGGPGENSASLTALLEHTGMYRVLGRIRRNSTDGGSIQLQPPGADSVNWLAPVSDDYLTDYVGLTPRLYLYLPAGSHTFHIFSNRVNTSIDWIEFQYLGEDPAGDTDADGVTNTNDPFPNDNTR